MRTLLRSSAGYDSSEKTPRGCLKPPPFGEGLPGRPRQIFGPSSTLHIFARASLSEWQVGPGPVDPGRPRLFSKPCHTLVKRPAWGYIQEVVRNKVAAQL